MIELKNVSFLYSQGQKEKGLHNINLTIRRGEVVLLCGESGCGKTTLTRLLNGLIPNYYEGSLEGEVLINGQAVHKLPLYETAKMVGSVFQNPRSQFFNVDTRSELAFGCENMGLPAAEFEARIAVTVSGKNEPPAIKIDFLAVPRGSIVAIIGHNGAGKSTFARCLCGLEKKCKGMLDLCGVACKAKERLKRCYMVMQDVNHQLFTESVLDEILLSMDEADTVKAENILNSLDLLELKDLHPMSLSGGQKQRVAIASAVASGKEILLFDEPTSRLDLRHMREVSDNLKKLQQMGKTLLIISHDLELILACCTHVLHFEKGGVIDNYPLNDKGEKKLISFFIRSTRYMEDNYDAVCI